MLQAGSETSFKEDLSRKVESEDAVLISGHQFTLVDLFVEEGLELGAEGGQAINLEPESCHQLLHLSPVSDSRLRLINHPEAEARQFIREEMSTRGALKTSCNLVLVNFNDFIKAVVAIGEVS